MPPGTSDLELRMSGGTGNTTGTASIGGAMYTGSGAGIITPGTLHNLFDAVASGERVAGDIEYRCVYLFNDHPTDAWEDVLLWIDDQPTNATLAIGLDPAAIGSTATCTSANEGAAPTGGSGVTFSAPSTKGGGLSVGDIPAGSRKAFWIRRTVAAGATVTTPDTGSIRAETT